MKGGTMVTNYSSRSDALPIINGILYGNGNVQYYDINVDQDDKRSIKMVQAILEEREYVKTTAYINAQMECEDMDIRFFIGEGSYGGDGWILAESMSTETMVFLISFDDSNPFVKICRNGKQLLVENNCGEQWVIEMQDMCNIGLSIASQKSH